MAMISLGVPWGTGRLSLSMGMFRGTLVRPIVRTTVSEISFNISISTSDTSTANAALMVYRVNRSTGELTIIRDQRFVGSLNPYTERKMALITPVVLETTYDYIIGFKNVTTNVGGGVTAPAQTAGPYAVSMTGATPVLQLPTSTKVKSTTFNASYFGVEIGSDEVIYADRPILPLKLEVTYNNSPTWSTIPAQTVRKNTTATVNLNSYANDADSNALTFTVSSSNTGVATVSVSGGTLTIRGAAIGTSTITVNANDGNGGVMSTTFTVTCANTGPVGTTMPNQTTKKNSTVTVNLANHFSDVDNDNLTFTASSANINVATVSVSGNILTIRGVSIGSALITVTASDSKLTASQSFTTTVTNSVPTVAVTAPVANVTLYENDLFNLAGQAADVDANQSVTIYAQINNDQRIVLAVGLSNAPVTFNKSLKFVGGQLFDGEVAVSGNLIDGVAHTVKIWAQDGDGAQSSVTERTFYTVPNRPPLITVDTIVPNGIINSDIITISGTAGDPDANAILASYRVNSGNSVPLEVNDGKWAFDITLEQLEVGQNAIVVEVVDIYHSKVSKTIKLNKNEVKTPILHSVARYKIEPPKGSAKGVLLYLQRDEDLTDLTVELSMVIQGEQENYVTLTSDNTAPISEGIVEDEFYFEADEAKNHIILKLSTTRPDVSIDHKIHLISGVLE